MPSSCRSAPESPLQFRRPALVVGHPGHELKVFGWMSECRPRVYVITDGSGRHGIPRTSSTAALIQSLNAQTGEVFGSAADSEVYRAILEHNFSFFLSLIDELANSFLEHEIDCVAGDAAEGFNPTHDLCRSLINAAVLVAERTSGREISNFEVSLTEWEQNCPQAVHDDRCLHWILSDRLLAEKLAAADQYVELKHEVERAIAARGKEYFRLECLRRTDSAELPNFNLAKPGYEIWGEQRVAAGHYCEVIRFKQHILPIMEAMLNHSSQSALEFNVRSASPGHH